MSALLLHEASALLHRRFGEDFPKRRPANSISTSPAQLNFLDSKSVSDQILQSNYINCFPDAQLRRLFLYRLHGSNSSAIFVAPPKFADPENPSHVSKDIRELRNYLEQKKVSKFEKRFALVAHCDVLLTSDGPQIFPAYISEKEARKVRYFRHTPSAELSAKIYGSIAKVLERIVEDRAKDDPNMHLANLDLPKRQSLTPSELEDVGILA